MLIHRNGLHARSLSYKTVVDASIGGVCRHQLPSRRSLAARVTTAEPGKPDPAASIFLKRSELPAAEASAVATAAVWPRVFTAEELAKSELYRHDFKRVVHSVTVTLPPPLQSKAAKVLLFFNGFQARASWYQHLMAKLAAAGCATVQYDTPELGPFVQTFDFEDEVKALPALLQWLQQQNDDPSNETLYKRLDLQQVAVAGHSRGGKLAALHFARGKGQTLKAAYLVDPVDELQPAAVAELDSSHLKIGATAAGVTGAFNPQQTNFRHFLAASANGSQLHELPSTRHLQFCDAGIYINGVLDTADILFSDAGLTVAKAMLLLTVYLYLAGRKTSNKALPASAALGSNNTAERVALFRELFSSMQEDLMKRHTSLQDLLPGLGDEQQLQTEWEGVLQVVAEQDEGQVLEKTMLTQLASMDTLTSQTGTTSASSLSSLGSMNELDRAVTMDMKAVVPGTDEVREKVAVMTAQAMKLWLDDALR